MPASRFPLALALLVSVAAMAADDDPFLWLEDIEGDKALEWVRAQNDRSLGELTKDERYQGFYDAAVAIAEDKSRIPMGTLRDGWLYNFWQDETNVRGLWRRATLDSYKTPTPEWQTLLDVDALAKSEGRNWVFKGVTCLPPQGRLCLVELSDGGKDASVRREFNVESRAFVENGFSLPEAKSDVEWKDANTLLLGTNWGLGTVTESGYPFIVKQWARGTPLAEAKEVYRGKPTDVAVAPFAIEGASGERLVGVVQAETFFTASYWTFGVDGGLARITLPPKVQPHALYRGQFVFDIKQDWSSGGKSWPSGTLMSMPVSDVASEAPALNLLFTPGPRDSIDAVAGTRSGILVASYSNVRGRLLRFSLSHGRWTFTPVPLPDNGAIDIVSTDAAADAAFVGYQDFLQPTTLYAVDVAANAAAASKSLPAKFDASRYVTEQLEATSRDGTKVPYFVVRSKSFTADGTAPTLLYAYGGFQVSELPFYSAVIGQLWLDRGGVYVLANIRGGGEFGPAWHEAGLEDPSPGGLRRFHRGGRRSDRAQGHLAAPARYPGRLERWTADGRDAHAAAGAIQRGGGASPAAGHAPLSQAARRRFVGGRVRLAGCSGRARMAREVLALSESQEARRLPGALHTDFDQGRPGSPRPRAQVRGEDGKPRYAFPILREHRGRAFGCCQPA